MSKHSQLAGAEAVAQGRGSAGARAQCTHEHSLTSFTVSQNTAINTIGSCACTVRCVVHNKQQSVAQT